MSICYILIGLPASGKSTWREANVGPVVASSDDHIEAVAARENKTYSEVFESAISEAEVVFREAIIDAYSEKKDLIIDRTNLFAKKRAHLIKEAKRNGYRVVAVWFAPPATEGEWAVWENRLKERGDAKKIPWHVLNSMAANMQMPTLDEGFNEVTTVYSWG